MKKISLTALLFGVFTAGSVSASPFSIEMVADNDFAIFSGTSTSINNLLYQNNANWYDQVDAVSQLTFNLAAGDNTFYVLGMGGGGDEENISGIVNGVNMTDSSVSVLMSSDLSGFLSGYPSTYYSNNPVENANYSPLLSEVQAAFSSLTWGAPVLNSTQTVIAAGGFGQGFIFSELEARLFAFEAQEVNVSVPEPSILMLLGFGLTGLALRSRRKRIA